MGSLKYDPERDIPDLSGKVILVTGGTAGLGKESVLALAKHNPAKIYFTGRNETSAKGVLEASKKASPSVPVSFITCDLASLDSVRNAAKQILNTESRLDILMCNAGVMRVPPSRTKEGYEIQFGTNHVGHALLIKLLLPLMENTAEQPNADVRIVCLSSRLFTAHPKGGIIFDKLKTDQSDLGALGSWYRYGQSKLANLLYARELAGRYPKLTVTAIHPGIINTAMVGNMSLVYRALIFAANFGRITPPEEGAYNSLWAATGKKGDGFVNGEYYEPVGELTKTNREASNDELARKLWEWTEKELENYN